MPSNLGDAVLRLGADAKPLDQDLANAEQRTSSKLASMGKTLTKTLTPAVLAIGATVLAAANSVDEAFATIQTGTGATGKALEDLKQDFKGVYGTAPGDAQAVASALAEVNTRLGLTGPSLQKTTRIALEMADAMGVDATAAITKTTQAMSVFGVDGDQATQVMDKMFVVSQTTGIGIGELTGQLQTFGPVLNNAGFSMDEATAILGQLNANGVDASRVFPGLNAFFRKTAEAGGDMRQEFAQVAERMQQAATDADALTIATAAFGAEGAQRMVPAIRNGSFELDELMAAMEASEGATLANAESTRTLTERFEMMRREVGERLGAAFLKLPTPIQGTAAALAAAAGSAGPLLQALPGLATATNALTNATKFKTAALKLATIAQKALNVAMLKNPIGIIVLAIGTLVGAMLLAEGGAGSLRQKFQQVWDAIKPMWDALVNIWKTAVKPALESLWRTLSEDLLPTLMSIWDVLSPVLIPALRMFATILMNNVVTAVKVITGGLQLLAALLTGDFAGAWRAVRTIVLEMVSGIINGVDAMMNALPDKFIPDGWAESVRNAKAVIGAELEALKAKSGEAATGMRDAGSAVDDMGSAVDDMGSAVEDAGAKVQDAQPAVDGLAGSVEAADTATDAAAQSALDYGSNLTTQAGAARDATEAEQKLAEAIAAANTARREGAESCIQFGGSVIWEK